MSMLGSKWYEYAYEYGQTHISLYGTPQVASSPYAPVYGELFTLVMHYQA